MGFGASDDSVKDCAAAFMPLDMPKP